MRFKLRAAGEAARAGIPTRLARGDTPGILAQIARGADVGTEVAAARGRR
jgi:glutamate 5-kinase